jgi:hypothetical protein
MRILLSYCWGNARLAKTIFWLAHRTTRSSHLHLCKTCSGVTRSLKRADVLDAQSASLIGPLTRIFTDDYMKNSDE